jgi:hypothetical protein
VQPNGIVIGFDIFKYRLAHHGFACIKPLTVNGFDLERMKEDLGAGIIVTTTLGAHAA